MSQYNTQQQESNQGCWNTSQYNVRRQEHPGLVEHESIQGTKAREQTDNYLPLNIGDSDVENQGSEDHFTSISNDAMIINKNCNNGSANGSPSTVNRVQYDNIVNSNQGGSEAGGLKCRRDHQIMTSDRNEIFLHNEGQTDNHPSLFFEPITIYYQQQL